MTLTKLQQRHDRRKREKLRKQYLRDRLKEPMFPLAESLANALGDIAPGTPLTAPELQRCLRRVADIRAGKARRSGWLEVMESLNAKQRA